MKAYLRTTGVIFGLLALLHLWRSIAEWPSYGSQPWWVLAVPGIAVAAAALSLWAWRLLRAQPRS
jgi:hypothetical protein